MPQRLSADKIAKSLPSAEKVDDEAFVQQAFRVILGIEPTAAEVAASLQALHQWRTRPDDQKRSPHELLIWALLNHNDFVTLR